MLSMIAEAMKIFVEVDLGCGLAKVARRRFSREERIDLRGHGSTRRKSQQIKKNRWFRHSDVPNRVDKDPSKKNIRKKKHVDSPPLLEDVSKIQIESIELQRLQPHAADIDPKAILVSHWPFHNGTTLKASSDRSKNIESAPEDRKRTDPSIYIFISRLQAIDAHNRHRKSISHERRSGSDILATMDATITYKLDVLSLLLCSGQGVTGTNLYTTYPRFCTTTPPEGLIYRRTKRPQRKGEIQLDNKNKLNKKYKLIFDV
ncbi:hypothetical protein ACLOJK_013666 [Asimina triloba]